MKTKKLFIIMLGIFLTLIVVVFFFQNRKLNEFSKPQEQYEEVLPKDILKKCDLNVTYNQLIEKADEYQMKTTIVMSGEIKEKYETINGIQQVEMVTKDGIIKGHIEDKSGTLDLEFGKEYVICGQFQGLDNTKNIPMFHILIMKKAEDNK